MREADFARRCPVEHGRDHRTGLADEGDTPRRWRQMGEAGVKADPRYHHADAIRPNQPEKMRSCRIERGLLQSLSGFAELAETGGDNDCCLRAVLTQFGDEP